MRFFIKLNLFLLCLFLLDACSPSDQELPEEVVNETGELHETDDTPVVETITEESIENVLVQFKIMDYIKYDKNINPTLNYSSQLLANGVSEDKNISHALNYSSQSLANRVSKDENCNHEIKTTIHNKEYNFDLNRDYKNNPLTEAEIQQVVNAPLISTTESSVKYFLSDKTPSTDCETEELDAPVPNHDDVDGLLRPTFYSYDNIFDYLGEHHYSNEFYIERSEITTPRGRLSPSSKFITKGILEKRVDRKHQVHVYTKATHSHVENLNLSGYMKSQKGYRFHFMNGSSKYFRYSFIVNNELSSKPTYGNTEIGMVNRFVVQFYMNYKDGPGRVSGVFRIPFVFDITIDYEKIIETLKDNKGGTYTKTVPLYVRSGVTNRNIGTVKFILDEEEIWKVDVTERPLKISDSELKYILDNFN